MQLELKQIAVQPGNQLLLKEITWQMYETILSELGESRASRLSYSKRYLLYQTFCSRFSTDLRYETGFEPPADFDAVPNITLAKLSAPDRTHNTIGKGDRDFIA